MTRLNRKTQNFRAWKALSIFVGIVVVASCLTATTTVWILGRTARSHSASNDPLSVAERTGVFQKIRSALKSPSINIGIEGNVLLVEGTAESDAEITHAIDRIKAMLPAKSFYVIYPYQEQADWITGRVQAIREGEYDYKNPNQSVTIVNLIRTTGTRHAANEQHEPKFIPAVPPVPPLPPRPEF